MDFALESVQFEIGLMEAMDELDKKFSVAEIAYTESGDSIFTESVVDAIKDFFEKIIDKLKNLIDSMKKKIRDRLNEIKFNVACANFQKFYKAHPEQGKETTKVFDHAKYYKDCVAILKEQCSDIKKLIAKVPSASEEELDEIGDSITNLLDSMVRKQQKIEKDSYLKDMRVDKFANMADSFNKSAQKVYETYSTLSEEMIKSVKEEAVKACGSALKIDDSGRKEGLIKRIASSATAKLSTFMHESLRDYAVLLLSTLNMVRKFSDAKSGDGKVLKGDVKKAYDVSQGLISGVSAVDAAYHIYQKKGGYEQAKKDVPGDIAGEALGFAVNKGMEYMDKKNNKKGGTANE